jgi:hypothetical protein
MATATATRELEVRWRYADGDVDISDAHPIPADAPHLDIVATLAALDIDRGDQALAYRTMGSDEPWTTVDPADWPCYDEDMDNDPDEPSETYYLLNWGVEVP